MRLALAFILCASLAHATERRGGRRDTTVGVLKGGQGIDRIPSDPCAWLNGKGYLTGNYVCKSGDDVAWNTAEERLEPGPVGSPTASTDAVCPNGPACGDVNSWRTSSGSAFGTTAVEDGPATMHMCGLGAVESFASTPLFVGKDDIATKRSYYIGFTSGGVPVVAAYTNSGTLNQVSSGTAPLGVLTLVCGTWDGETLTMYVNGTATGTPSGPGSGAIDSYSDTPICLAARGGSCTAGTWPGRLIAAWKSDYDASAADMAAIAAAFRPAPQTSHGAALTTTRTTTRGCIDSSGEGSIIASGVPCVKDAALSVWAAHKNWLLQSSGLPTAWTLRGTAAVVSNDAIAPDGTLTADKVTVGTGTNDVYQVTSGGAASVATRPSVYIKRVSTTGTLYMKNPSDAAAGNISINMAALPDDWELLDVDNAAVTTVTAAFANTSGGGGGIQFQAASGTISFHVWEVYWYEGAVTPPRCPTTTTTATCNLDAITVATTDWPVGSGSITLYYTPQAQPVGRALPAYLIDGRTSATTPAWGVLVSTLGRLTFLTYNGGTNTVEVTAGATWTLGQRHKITVDWSDGAATFWKDEALLGSGSITLPAAIQTTAIIGSAFASAGSGYQANGTVEIACIGPSGVCR